MNNFFFKKIKDFVVTINNKLLLITDKICIIYDKYIFCKSKLLFNFFKKNLIYFFLKFKAFCIFISEFYKKDKKRAIIYFILIYFLYRFASFAINKAIFLFKHNKNDITVLVRMVKPERIQKEINCYGYLESENNLQYLSEVRGNIDKIYVQEKQQVKKGQLIMSLDSKFTVNAYISAKSILASKEMQFNAMKKMFQNGLESKSNLNAMEADFENVKSNFESAQKAYNGLQIYAPFDGYVDNISLKEGSQINIGSRLFTIEKNDAMHVKCDVNNVSQNDINIGDNVDVFISGEKMGRGNISVIGNSVDIYTGNRAIIINNIVGLNGFEDSIVPGISVMIKLKTNSNKDTFKISSEALEVTDTGGYMVKVINQQNKTIEAKHILIYDEKDGIDYVLGLDDEDLVIERGHEFVQIGEKDITYSKINDNNIKMDSLLLKIKKKIIFSLSNINFQDFCLKKFNDVKQFLLKTYDILIKYFKNVYEK